MMEIFDSHTHWGPSITLGTEVTTDELLPGQESGVDRIVAFPFPSTTIEDERINEKVLELGKKNGKFIPYYYIPEDLRPIPKERNFYGAKWHWVRGIQDCSSNYQVLDDPHLDPFIEASEAISLPIVFEEELAFTEAFVKERRFRSLFPPGNVGEILDFL
jgi:hypothetical protein